MPPKHVHKWSVLKPDPAEPDWYIWCEGCGDRMDTIEEIERRLNVIEELGAAITRGDSDRILMKLILDVIAVLGLTSDD